MDHTKIDTADLDFLRRELSNSGLGFVVALLVRSGIDFSCASTRNPILFLMSLVHFDHSCLQRSQLATR